MGGQRMNELEACGEFGFHEMGVGEFAGVTAADVLERMQEATGTKSLSELAGWLGVNESCLAEVTRKGLIPILWMRELVLRDSDYNPAWVLTGRGSKLWENPPLNR